MNKNDVIELEGREASTDPLSEQLLPGAQKLIYQAIEAEPAACLEQHAERQTPPRNAGVVRNGYLPGRELQTSLGPVTIKIPKVRARTSEPVTFQSALRPMFAKRVQKWLETRQQCCWMHKTMNVLNGLPRSSQPKAKNALHSIWQAETKTQAEKAFDPFIATYDAKHPKGNAVFTEGSRGTDGLSTTFQPSTGRAFERVT